MIIIISLAVLLVAALVLAMVFEKKWEHDVGENRAMLYYESPHEEKAKVFSIITGIMIIVFVANLTAIALINIFSYSKYNTVVALRETIVKQLEKGDHYITAIKTDGEGGQKIVVKNYIEQAYQFNAYIKTRDYYGNSYFTNLYINPFIRKNAESLYINVDYYLGAEK